MNIYLYKFNNYYNRIIKRKESIEDYNQAGQLVATQASFDFNPNDGVTTTCIFNYISSDPDYCVVTDENGIVSRWFVLEAKRTTYGQYQCNLYRDTIADNKTDVINADCFIEKATLNEDDPAIFNKEDIAFNQIKTSETLLKDKTGCAWLVAYAAKNKAASTITVSGSSTPIYRAFDFEDSDLYNYMSINPSPHVFRGVPSNTRLGINYRIAPIRISANLLNIDNNTIGYESAYNIGGDYGFQLQGLEDTINAAFSDAMVTYGWDNLRSIFDTQYSGIDLPHTQSELTDLLSLNGQLIKNTNDNKIYLVDIVPVGTLNIAESIDPNSALGIALSNIVYLTSRFTGSPSVNTFFTRYSVQGYAIRLTEQTISETQITFQGAGSHTITSDAVYDLFCVPYGDSVFYIGSDGTKRQLNKSYALNMMTSIATQDDANIYDIQLLPYCPINYHDLQEENNELVINLTDFETEEKIAVVKSSITYFSLFYCTASNFHVDLGYSIDISNYKLSNECDVYRLCSPNYNGQFEFSPAKNFGVERFEADCTYKPYIPYIHVAPIFKNLYGQDFDDARGLICGGDFSISRIKDAWEAYELQNKNYLNIFDRQIQNMEFNNSMQRAGDIIGGVTGALSTGMAGALTGAKIGGGVPGAVIGGAIGSVAGVAGAVGDFAINEAIRNETLDYTKDQFGYQLGNIKALPYSLSKVSCFNTNNKIFPFIEYYTCTDVERQALIDKLKFNGMTVMRIGKITDFLRAEPTYIKAKLIRDEQISEDYHMLRTIAQELDKGVFISWE